MYLKNVCFEMLERKNTLYNKCRLLCIDIFIDILVYFVHYLTFYALFDIFRLYTLGVMQS